MGGERAGEERQGQGAAARKRIAGAVDGAGPIMSLPGRVKISPDVYHYYETRAVGKGGKRRNCPVGPTPFPWRSCIICLLPSAEKLIF